LIRADVSLIDMPATRGLATAQSVSIAASYGRTVNLMLCARFIFSATAAMRDFAVIWFPARFLHLIRAGQHSHLTRCFIGIAALSGRRRGLRLARHAE
jgi:hypothetical protein